MSSGIESPTQTVSVDTTNRGCAPFTACPHHELIPLASWLDVVVDLSRSYPDSGPNINPYDIVCINAVNVDSRTRGVASLIVPLDDLIDRYVGGVGGVRSR
jgi:hypothetical protein